MSYRLEQTDSGMDIVIDGWESGIADSPYATSLQTPLGVVQQSGLSDMRNVNVISVPGEASVNFKSQSIAQTPIAGAAYTAATSGTFTYSGTALKNGTKITLNSVTGGTQSLLGVPMIGNTTSLVQQTASTTTGATRVLTSSNTLAGTSATINIGFIANANNGDVVSLIINGQTVTIQFVTAIGTTAGNVLIGGNAASTAYNLQQLLKNPGTTNTTQVAFSLKNQQYIGYFSSGWPAVAFDAVSNGGATGTLTFNSGTTGTLTNGVALVIVNTNSNTISGVTWGGSPMTSVYSDASFTAIYMLANPPSGVKSVVVSGASTQIEACAITYSGISQTLALDNSAGTTSINNNSNVVQALTPNTAGSWIIMSVAADTGNPYTASTGMTSRSKSATSGWPLLVGDSNAQEPATSYSMTATKDGVGSGAHGWRMFSLAPFVGNVTVGLTTTSSYWVQNATGTTFTLSTFGPKGDGTITNISAVVAASASGTFTTLDLALFTQIVPNATNTCYYGIDTNGRVWVYNLNYPSTNWVYLGNTVTAAPTPDFGTGIAVWNNYIVAFYDGPSGYFSYTRPLTDTYPQIVTLSGTASTDTVVLTTGSTASWNIAQDTKLIYTGSTTNGLTQNTVYYAGLLTGSASFKLFTSAGSVGLVDITSDFAGIFFTNLSVGAYGTFSAFKGLNTGAVSHRTFIDKSNTLNWCDGGQIGSLIQLNTFNPNVDTSYTYSAGVFAKASTDTFQCLDQLGNSLVIGGQINAVYSWDRVSTGYTVILLPENNCRRIVVVNSNAYLFVGNRGRIYVTNGANAELYKKVPDHLSGTIEPIFAWGGATYNKNQIYFSLSTFGSGEATETGISTSGGIWAVDTNTNALRLVNQLSYATYGGYCAEMTGMIANTTSTSGIPIQNFGLVCGWEDSTETASPNYGSDVLPVNASPTVSNVPYSNYESYVDSDMIPVGTFLNPTTDAQIEYKLAVPMVSGEAIKFSYRQDLSQSFTPITSITRPTGEFTSADTSGGLSGYIPVNFQKSQWVQIRAFLKSTSTTPSYVRLKQLRIR